MPARRRTAAAITTVTTLGVAALALGATPASAHGSMGDPVSRVAQCYAEGPEHPASAACRAAVAAGGTQALYDWNGIRIGDAGGRHQALIPDGELCSAGNDEFRGLDLARADWPATGVRGGSYTFRYRVTAPHKGTFVVYLTKTGYDPAQPLSWADLDLDHPVATATDPVAAGGFYTFSGTLPQRSGRELPYAIWQRSDSPEAFYSCSDVTFGASSGAGEGAGEGAGTGASSGASAPSEEQIADGADESTVGHTGHAEAKAEGSTSADASPDPSPANSSPGTPSATSVSAPVAQPKAAGAAVNLAETGGTSGTSYLAVGGAGALAVGAAALFLSVRRRAVGGGGRSGR
ncbi:lytic polysaccharide monooxygenase [Streptomyces sp. SID12488]|uniref:lytic polysaccharide monooxygenase auxiliary activity family 9 protein n=1 Tax=Streptomyces sp. SID12488 TaxID=2706040 RepID=UPI0013DAA284|nr:lytic polysaccharide monooxygenase [Streptomyces sp. SID12488]NEA67661.1 lytic polysaccharide monooxygenase [Streptomyces sp. SID12488]